MLELTIYTSLFLLSFLASTLLVRLGIPRLKSSKQIKKILPESQTAKPFDLRSTGLWIGFCETFLIFVLVCQNEYGALAVIIGAKEFVRKEKIQQNPSYYLLGTLINLSIAIGFALLAGRLTRL